MYFLSTGSTLNIFVTEQKHSYLISMGYHLLL